MKWFSTSKRSGEPVEKGTILVSEEGVTVMPDDDFYMGEIDKEQALALAREILRKHAPAGPGFVTPFGWFYVSRKGLRPLGSGTIIVRAEGVTIMPDAGHYLGEIDKEQAIELAREILRELAPEQLGA